MVFALWIELRGIRIWNADHASDAGHSGRLRVGMIEKREVARFHFLPHVISCLIVPDAAPRFLFDLGEIVDAEDVGFGFDEPVAHGKSGDGFDEIRFRSGQGKVLGAEFEAFRGTDVGFDGFEHIEFRPEIRGVIGTSNEWPAGDVAEAFG